MAEQPNKKKHPLDEWLEHNAVHDKDKEAWKQARQPVNKEEPTGNTPFASLNPADYKKVAPKVPRKFLTGEKDEFIEWIEKNDLYDKDKEGHRAEIRMYPPHLKIPSRITSEIDLHGLTVAEAQLSLQWFVENGYKNNVLVMKIIHGKGKHSKGTSRVKQMVLNWLHHQGKRFVRYIKPADPQHGGLGATIIWLR